MKRLLNNNGKHVPDPPISRQP